MCGIYPRAPVSSEEALLGGQKGHVTCNVQHHSLHQNCTICTAWLKYRPCFYPYVVPLYAIPVTVPLSSPCYRCATVAGVPIWIASCFGVAQGIGAFDHIHAAHLLESST